MKRMAERPLIRLPDGRYLFPSDFRRVRLVEFLKGAAAFVVLVGFLVVVLFGMGLTDPMAP